MSELDLVICAPCDAADVRDENESSKDVSIDVTNDPPINPTCESSINDASETVIEVSTPCPIELTEYNLISCFCILGR